MGRKHKSQSNSILSQTSLQGAGNSFVCKIYEKIEFFISTKTIYQIHIISENKTQENFPSK